MRQKPRMNKTYGLLKMAKITLLSNSLNLKVYFQGTFISHFQMIV